MPEPHLSIPRVSIDALIERLPGEPDARGILERGFAMGLRGVKLHCHVQCFAPDDEALFIDHINAERAAVGLGPLTLDTSMRKAARAPEFSSSLKSSSTRSSLSSVTKLVLPSLSKSA